MPPEQLRARAVHVYRRARWYAGQARRMTREQGIAQTIRHGRVFIGTRELSRRAPKGLRPAPPAAAARPELPPLPAGGRTRWPLSLVVLGDPSDCRAYRYRCLHKQSMAKSLGIPVVLADVRDPDAARSALQLGSALILQQPSTGEYVEELLREARRLRQVIVYDVDSPAAAQPVQGVALARPDLVLCSSDALALQLEREGSAPVLVLGDGIDARASGLVEILALDPQFGRWSRGADGMITLALASSRPLTAADLDVALDGLRVALERHPRVQLRLFTSLTLPDTMKPFASRILTVRWDTYEEYLRNLAMSHIVLAPLAATGFNQATSPTLYWESALLQRPLVASPTMYGEHVVDGSSGLLARSTDDWIEHLDRLVSDGALRERIGTSARQELLSRGLADTQTESFRTVIAEISRLGAE